MTDAALKSICPGNRDAIGERASAEFPTTMAAARLFRYAPKPCRLQGRKLQIAQLVAFGFADKEIAHFLNLTESTVKAHLNMIYNDVGMRRRTQLARYIYERGLLPGP